MGKPIDKDNAKCVWARRASQVEMPLSLSCFERHAHAVFRAQGDDGLRGDLMIGHMPDLPTLRECCQHQYAFGKRESFADANAGAASKGEERELGALVRIAPRPTGGVELSGSGYQRGSRWTTQGLIKTMPRAGMV